MTQTRGGAEQRPGKSRRLRVRGKHPGAGAGDIVFFSSRRRHTRYWRDWSSDVCSSDLTYFCVRRRRRPRAPSSPTLGTGEGPRVRHADRYDVVVVGAGPAGAAAARSLAPDPQSGVVGERVEFGGGRVI